MGQPDHEQVRQQRHGRAGVFARHLRQPRREHAHRGLDAREIVGQNAVFLQRLDQIPGQEPGGRAVFDHAGDGQRVEELLPVVLHLFGEVLGHAGGVLIGRTENIRQQGHKEVLHVLRIVFA